MLKMLKDPGRHPDAQAASRGYLELPDAPRVLWNLPGAVPGCLGPLDATWSYLAPLAAIWRPLAAWSMALGSSAEIPDSGAQWPPPRGPSMCICCAPLWGHASRNPYGTLQYPNETNM